MGLSGLKWLLEELHAIRHLQHTPQGLFHFFRDGYRALEVSGLKNNRECFLEISEFHSSRQRGSVRILEGRWGFGWATFENNLRNFFLLIASPRALPVSDDAINRTMHQKGNNFKPRQSRECLCFCWQPSNSGFGSHRQ
jgi:hypothetical protein